MTTAGAEQTGWRGRAAVVGAGHFGRFHAQKYAQHAGVEFAGVVDPVEGHARAAAAGAGGSPVWGDWRDIPGGIDLASVAAPARWHGEVAGALLAAGVHVLVEKPIAATVAEADDLIGRAQAAGRVLQVGHQERFFLRELDWRERLGPVERIEVDRLGPPPPRPPDCGVVLDILVHDLDWIHWLLPEDPVEVRARCLARGRWVEAVEAELEFAGGTRVVLRGSRQEETRRRQAVCRAKGGLWTVDFMDRWATGPDGSPVPELGAKEQRALYGEHPFAARDYLGKAIAHFIACARENRQPLVDGASGRRALATALRIEAALETSHP